MTESGNVRTDDPLKRYVENPGDLRRLLDKSNAIVSGLWTLSTFIGDDRALLENLKRSSGNDDFGLRIIVPRDTDWAPIGDILEKKDGYQMRGNPMASHGGVLFVRENGDDLPLELDEKKDIGWNMEGSLQAKTVHTVMNEGLGCFMTSKYAVLVCEHQPGFTDGNLMEKIRKSIVAEYEAQPQRSTTKRWKKLKNKIFCIVELDNLDIVPGSFNELLWDNNVFEKVSALMCRMKEGKTQ